MKEETPANRAVRPLRGVVEVPGDKSIMHRALILSALAEGVSDIIGCPSSEDCRRTMNAFRGMGVSIQEKTVEGRSALQVSGRGLFGFSEPTDLIDCGNSGTTLRLLTGLLSGQPFFSTLTGDASLRKRPMRRVIDPLRTMGAEIFGRSDGALAPLAIVGKRLSPIEYTLPVPSAQVKSALLLAGLMASGRTSITDPYGSRDHTERIFAHFGARCELSGKTFSIVGRSPFPGKKVVVPGDISSAAFLIVGALIVPDSEITIRNVGVNPTRAGLLTVLKTMGAQIDIQPVQTASYEPVADITVRASPLTGVTIGETEEGALGRGIIPSLIDEIPILCIAAAAAEGETRIRGAEELRVKESDRIATMARGLRAIGVAAQELPDGIRIKGTKKWIEGQCVTERDHRVAMSMIIASLRTTEAITLDDEACIDTSFPEFRALLGSLLVG